MDELEKEYIVHFYSRSLMLHGNRPEAMRWSPEGQARRYEAILDVIGSLDGNNLLDFGCGRGDFVAFLKQRDISVNYTGIDITPGFSEIACDTHPDENFELRDIDLIPLDETENFDHTILCGVFNNRLDGNIINFTNFDLDRTKAVQNNTHNIA